jgi:hypothetical protein
VRVERHPQVRSDAFLDQGAEIHREVQCDVLHGDGDQNEDADLLDQQGLAGVPGEPAQHRIEDELDPGGGAGGGIGAEQRAKERNQQRKAEPVERRHDGRTDEARDQQ